MNKKKILVVDDEVLILNLLKDGFQPAGYKVLTAESGEEVLKILQRESVMVMFLDIKLPDISGVELCKKIRIEIRFALFMQLPVTKIFMVFWNVVQPVLTIFLSNLLELNYSRKQLKMRLKNWKDGIFMAMN